jgi:hypothetical protein
MVSLRKSEVVMGDLIAKRGTRPDSYQAARVVADADQVDDALDDARAALASTG